MEPNKYFNGDSKILLNFPCENCKKIVSIDIDSKEFNDFRYGWHFKCPECGDEITTCRYVFWDNYKDKKKKLRIVK